MPTRKIVDIDMDAKKPYAKLGHVFHLGFLSLTCDSFRVLRVAATVSRTVAPTKQRIAGDSGRCRSVFRGMPITGSGMMAITIPG